MCPHTPNIDLFSYSRDTFRIRIYAFDTLFGISGWRVPWSITYYQYHCAIHTSPRTRRLSRASFDGISICSTISKSNGFPGRFTVRTASVTISVKWSASYVTHLKHKYFLFKLCSQRGACYVIKGFTIILDILHRLLPISFKANNKHGTNRGKSVPHSLLTRSHPSAGGDELPRLNKEQLPYLTYITRSYFQ